MLVYRPDGVAEDKDPVDARECVKHCGYSTTPPDVAVKATVVAEEATVVAEEPDQFENMDEAALRAYLTEHGKTPHHLTKEAKLRAMCREVASELV